LSIAFSTLIILVALVPGLICSNKLLVYDGNTNVNHPFSISIILSIVLSPLIHLPVFFAVNHFDIFRNINTKNVINFISEPIELIQVGATPTILEVVLYMLTTSLIGYFLGRTLMSLREKALLFSISYEITWLYKTAKFNSDWFNYFYGFSHSLPQKQLPAKGATERFVKKRDVLVTFYYKSLDGSISFYQGTVLDYTQLPSGELYSILVEVIVEQEFLNQEFNINDEDYDELEASIDINPKQTSEQHNNGGIYPQKLFQFESISSLDIQIYDYTKSQL